VAGDFAFPRSARLTVKRAYDKVFRHGVRSSDAAFTVLACRNGLDRARLGLAVSRKTARRANRRNRIKRVIRESFRHAAARGLPAADVVVIARRDADQTPGASLHASLERHWKRITKRCAD
jgi:ribonuclease P protein component